ncbi:Farnesyl pyrophosphate synthetase [Aspergillus melleus]|uniref:Farnesyl pyrophosphate synthetase n=1 Tax=Aspergillus melleus TaxID=138277 RepID=UPI001E8E2B2F|nr:Farnesyl pyrophosphate synthetase [Aspergillus melleus]KAH8433988.1 Farnesyl pyrophosphate synthetase [Aspergillus melleus]
MNECSKAVLSPTREGWVIEVWKGYIYIVDDIIDGSEIRRGRPCWHLLLPGTGLQALNDSCILKSLVHLVLRRFFHNKSAYPRLSDVMQEITYLTELGQNMDIMMSQQKIRRSGRGPSTNAWPPSSAAMLPTISPWLTRFITWIWRRRIM